MGLRGPAICHVDRDWGGRSGSLLELRRHVPHPSAARKDTPVHCVERGPPTIVAMRLLAWFAGSRVNDGCAAAAVTASGG
uniref:Putative soluble starch synthase n=1 Tax=Triticum turgidum subsp. durum TaxID=4567 RepID=Q575T5_TRITD|nr:putative soluble starch synthase [Triticum turgidum subsp. durum]